ncbi:MAG: hypothetical protein J5601_05635 [Elusimicrobiaceae bacterium]|nr:hypothetical protein [Elusimicrobiaceae bacterium]
MKRSLAVLGLLALSTASFSAAENYTREKVLALFATYNPAVLERAQQDEAYRAVLETVASSYNIAETDENRYTLIALIRNFDNSLKISSLTGEYERAYLVHVLNQLNPSAITRQFHDELTPIFEDVREVSLQLNELRLKEAKTKLRTLRKTTDLSTQEKEQTRLALRQEISSLKQEIKNLKKDISSQLSTSVDSFISSAQSHVLQTIAHSQDAARLMGQSSSAQEAENLSIISKNKKPVAK